MAPQPDNSLLRAGCRCFIGFIIVVVLFSCAGCSKASGNAQSTSRVLSSVEVRGLVPNAICGDSAYAEVSSVWLAEFYETYKAELFRQGVVKYDSRFDCNHFAAYYASLAQTKFYLNNFQSWTKAQSLAVGQFWYFRNGSGHAIVIALTERGVVFVEPQTGLEVVLTPTERQSAYLVLL